MGGTELSLSSEENCRMCLRLYDLKPTPPCLISNSLLFSRSRRGKAWAEALHSLTGVPGLTIQPGRAYLTTLPCKQNPEKKLIAWREF